MHPIRKRNFVSAVNQSERVFSTLELLQHGDSDFYLCLGSTATSDVGGISAAGSSPAHRRLTPAADAEALVLGYPLSFDKLPVSPKGVVSPVVITRACLKLSDIQPVIVDCGSFVRPQIDCVEIGSEPALCVSSGRSMPLDMVSRLFRSGLNHGRELESRKRPLVIAECVPGGTTTAMGILTALGYSVRTALSSSIPNCNHDARWSLVEQGLVASGVTARSHPFEILAGLGDPMQPFVVGMILGACKSNPLVLAGGSQMLAVYALSKSLASEYSVDLAAAQVCVLTTKWVAFDRSASLSQVCADVGAPLAASCPDFLQSMHNGLRLYEEGNVKEGVGAGAALALGFDALNGNEAALMQAIDSSYEEMVGRALSAVGDNHT